MNLPSDASTDQDNCPPDYYRRSNGMLHQIPSKVDSIAAPLSLTDEELRTMARDKLSALLQSIDAKQSPSLLLSVAREVLDRLEGKPTQRIEQRVMNVKAPPSEMTNEQLLIALRTAEDKGLLPDGMKLIGSDLVTDADYVELKTEES